MDDIRAGHLYIIPYGHPPTGPIATEAFGKHHAVSSTYEDIKDPKETAKALQRWMMHLNDTATRQNVIPATGFYVLTDDFISSKNMGAVIANSFGTQIETISVSDAPKQSVAAYYMFRKTRPKLLTQDAIFSVTGPSLAYELAIRSMESFGVDADVSPVDKDMLFYDVDTTKLTLTNVTKQTMADLPKTAAEQLLDKARSETEFLKLRKKVAKHNGGNIQAAQGEETEKREP